MTNTCTWFHDSLWLFFVMIEGDAFAHVSVQVNEAICTWLAIPQTTGRDRKYTVIHWVAYDFEDNELSITVFNKPEQHLPFSRTSFIEDINQTIITWNISPKHEWSEDIMIACRVPKINNHRWVIWDFYLRSGVDIPEFVVQLYLLLLSISLNVSFHHLQSEYMVASPLRLQEWHHKELYSYGVEVWLLYWTHKFGPDVIFHIWCHWQF